MMNRLARYLSAIAFGIVVLASHCSALEAHIRVESDFKPISGVGLLMNNSQTVQKLQTTLSTSPDGVAVVSFEIHEDGIRISTAKATSDFSFDYVSRAVRTPKGILLFQDEKNFLSLKSSLGIHLSVYEKCDEHKKSWPKSANRLLTYAAEMQGKEVFQLVKNFEFRKLHERLQLSPTVLRHLEIFENYRGDFHGSLMSAIQKTKTSSGTRMTSSTGVSSASRRTTRAGSRPT